MPMTDEQVRVKLNHLLAQDESDLAVDDLLRLPPSAVSMFKLLIESQVALGEIADATPSCMACRELIQIARTHYKGGK